MKTGSQYKAKSAFKLAVAELNAQVHRPFVFPQNNKEEIKAACTDAQCVFFINAQIAPTGVVRVTSHELDHTCDGTATPTVKGYWLQEVAKKATRYDPLRDQQTCLRMLV